MIINSTTDCLLQELPRKQNVPVHCLFSKNNKRKSCPKDIKDSVLPEMLLKFCHGTCGN